MRHCFFVLAGVLCCVLSSVIGSYDAGYAVVPDQGHGWHGPGNHAHGQSAGSYYHYHVPLVGQQQQQHYQPSHQSDHSHYLWPLLLLLAIPLLFLPLLPLLLLPLGLSLLALLMPGGMMMMMMMMMMMPMMMPSPLGIRNENIGRALNEMRTLGDIVLSDISSLMTKYARSLDLDKCPQRLVCEFGSFIFPTNSTQLPTAKTLTAYIVEQAVPKGKARKMLRQYEKAFWLGSKSGDSCQLYKCQPAFHIYKENSPENNARGTPSKTQSVNSLTTLDETNYSNYQDSQHGYNSYNYTEYPEVPTNTVYKDLYLSQNTPVETNPQDNEVQGSSASNYYRVFGTPTIKS